MKQILTMLGFAVRAGQAALGSEKCVALIRADAAAVVLLDAEASENTKKRVTDACAYRNVPLVTLEEGALGRAIGKDGCAAVALKKGKIAQRITDLLSQQTESPPDR